ncbi:T9SS type B sorting domain-containing protein [Aquimarina mytili]|uniref:Gliding motility-associated C-terminal domain-containing protein n=1 Tax=Aquimarina mytili TaxID=874423 RepID=A0A937D942_9FLAO|nr:gliding motility-associated C-terminal domain-containing protein [Aquimarina mytili]MBL0684700.1 gliding motility-associated C-terminal domain-containing protein [Aquimarina mytili]
MKNKLNLISSFAIIALFLLFSSKSNAQDISTPLFSLNGTTTAIKRLCVNQNTPNREAEAQANILFTTGTEFILELSDADGVFADPAASLSRFTNSTAIPPGGDIIFPSFEVPKDLAGENYAIRVRAIPTDGSDDILSEVNEGNAIYFFDFSQGVTLTGANIEANTVALCEGESATLTALPDNFPEYIWTRNGSVISGESGPTLENVDQTGTYVVQVNFGSCNGDFNFDTAQVEVIDFNTSTVRINESSPQQFCPSDVKILTTSVTDPGFTYEWFRDGELVPELTGPTAILPESNFAGIYTVTVTGTPTCAITTDPVEVINLGSDILTQPPPQIMILPAQPTITLEITTNAPPSGSTVQWFRNGISFQAELPITDSRALSIEVSDPGVYVASVFANDSCMDTLTATTEVFEPVDFRAVITTLPNCEEASGNLGLETLFGIAATGEEVPILLEQYSFFDFEWFLNGQSTGISEPLLPITASNIGETYVLEVTLTGSSIPTVASNELTVEALPNGIEIVPSMSFLPVGSEITLSASQTSSLFVYEWFIIENGESRLIVNGECPADDPGCDGPTGQGTSELTIRQTGQYFLRITLLDCVIDSQPITITNSPSGVSEIIPNVVTPFGSAGQNDNWVLPDSLSGQQDVEVTIYDLNGGVDFKTVNYQDDWPLTSSKSGGKSPVYYYIITKNNSVVRKGSITVMR